MAKSIQHGILLGTGAAGLALVLAFTGSLNRLENLAWDWRARLLARPAATTATVRLVLLDQASLDWAAENLGAPWPWPRELHAAILDFCGRGNARAVAFDVIFSEPSAYGVADDEALGNAIENGPPFAGALFLGHETGQFTAVPEDALPATLPLPQISAHGRRPSRAPAEAPGFTRAVFPIPAVRATAARLGNVTAAPDADGIFRRIAPLAVFDGRMLPALGAAAFLAAAPGVEPVIEGRVLRLGERALPLDRRGRVILRYRGPSQTHPAVSAAAVINSEARLREGLEPQIDPDFFENAFVLYGFTAPGLFDLKASPVAGVYPGVEIHATLLDNLLAGDALRETPLALTGLLVLGLALAGGILARCCKSAVSGGALLVAAPLLPLLLGAGAYAAGYALAVAAPQAAATPAVAAGLLVNYAVEGRRRRFLKSAFKQYLSRDVIEQLIAHPESLQLGGEERELTLFFSDIRGFTTISENLSPGALTAVLNDYLTAMCDIIMDTGGTIDKFEGDAVIAFWNAPLARADHAARAIEAALRCRERLAALNPDFERRLGAALFTRIGLHTGPVVVGNLGSRQRFNYTFIGDAGNLASRIEGVNKVFGTGMLLTAQTAERAGGRFPLREIAALRVVGRKTPVTVFEPLAATPVNLQRKDIERFGEALRAWRAGAIEKAAAGFAALADRDPAAAAYRDRCLAMSGKPLPGTWDGIWDLTSK